MGVQARILCVGRTKARWVEEGVGVFAGRLRRVLTIVEVKDQRGAATPAICRQHEGARILKQAAPGFWLLDERGAALTRRVGCIHSAVAEPRYQAEGGAEGAALHEQRRLRGPVAAGGTRGPGGWRGPRRQRRGPGCGGPHTLPVMP